MFNRFLWKFILIVLAILLFLGGLGIETEVLQLAGVLIGLLILTSIAVQKKKLKLPPFIILYSIFLILFIINSFFISVDTIKSLEVLSLLLGGGLFWVVAYNLKKELAPFFDKLIILLGLVFAGSYFFNNFFGDPSLVKPWSLFLDYSAYRNHNNVGDLWAIAQTIVIFYLLKNPRNIYLWITTILGGYLLFISQSRAAYVALAAGVGYLAKVYGLTKKYKNIFTLFILMAVALFLIIGTQKTTLFTRQYYIQGVLGFLHNPEGIGVGNFDVISRNSENHIFGLSHFSSVAHNLLLEVLTGLGILGFVFVAWFLKVILQLWNDKNPRNLVYKAVFFTLTVNFLFHSSYFIPTMLWLWFLSLGLAQTRTDNI